MYNLSIYHFTFLDFKINLFPIMYYIYDDNKIAKMLYFFTFVLVYVKELNRKCGDDSICVSLW